MFNLARSSQRIVRCPTQTFDLASVAPPRTCEALAAASTRLGRVLEARSDPLGRTCNQFEFHRRPISRRHISRCSLVAGAEHFVDGLRKATVLEE